MTKFISQSVLFLLSIWFINLNAHASNIAIKFNENKNEYRRVFISVNVSDFKTSNRQPIYSFQIWRSTKPFSSILDAKLHSTIWVGDTEELTRIDPTLTYDVCFSDGKPIHRNSNDMPVISTNTNTLSCLLSGMVPKTNYWLAIIPVDKVGNNLLASEKFTVHQVKTSVADQLPPPPDTTSILVVLISIAVSIALVLVFLRWKDIEEDKRGARLAHIYVGPALIALAILSLYPITYGIWMSFTDAHQSHLGEESWIGLTNFFTVFTSKGAFRVALFSLIWAFISVASHIVFGLILALILNRSKLKFKIFYRTVLLLPWAIPGYISILAWKGMLQSDGLINILLGTNIEFLAHVSSAQFMVTFVSIWLGVPFMMMSLSGALVTIPKDMYEASELDGVSRWDQFLHITLPNLKSTIVPLSLLSFIFTFNSFNTIFLLTQGKPNVGFGEPGATDILITYVYEMAFQLGQYGIAAAWSVVIFLMLVSFSWMYMKKTKATEAIS